MVESGGWEAAGTSGWAFVYSDIEDLELLMFA